MKLNPTMYQIAPQAPSRAILHLAPLVRPVANLAPLHWIHQVSQLLHGALIVRPIASLTLSLDTPGYL